MNGKLLCDKNFGMTEERLKLEKVINEIFSEIDWLHPDYFGLEDEICDDDCKIFKFEVPNYVHTYQVSDHINKIQNILFSNGYVDTKEMLQTTRKINSINTIIYENPLFIAMDLTDYVVKKEFCKNGISFTKFRGNTCTDAYYTLTISKTTMEKL